MLLTCFTGQACAPTLSGQLLEANGEPVYHQDGRINISLINAKDASESYIVNLKADGSFDSPTNLKAGLYLVEALVPGYRLQSTQVELQSSQKAKLILEKLSPSDVDLIRYSGSSQGVGSGKVNLTPPQL